MPDPHRYEVELRWAGATGVGWENYERFHTATAPPAEQEIGRIPRALEKKGDLVSGARAQAGLTSVSPGAAR